MLINKNNKKHAKRKNVNTILTISYCFITLAAINKVKV